MLLTDLPDVLALDRCMFTADRSFFLKRRWELYPELSQMLVENDQIAGFILGRRGEDWVSAGPWVTAEDAQHPFYLLESLAGAAQDDHFSVGILECNQVAIASVRSMGLVERLGCQRLSTYPKNRGSTFLYVKSYAFYI